MRYIGLVGDSLWWADSLWWDSEDAEHIRTRSARYPGAVDGAGLDAGSGGGPGWHRPPA